MAKYNTILKEYNLFLVSNPGRFMSYKELRDKYVALRNEFVRTPSESTRFTELLKEMHRIKLKISELDKSISAR